MNAITQLVAISAISLGSDVTSSSDYGVGSPAPPLGDVVWHRGEPIETFEPGNVYLLEFWSTWCLPCLALIPSNNELASKHRDDGLVIIGVHVWPRDSAPSVEAFLHDRATNDSLPDVEYAIAEDISDSAMQAYITELHGLGLPASAIIDREGRLAWIGFTNMGMEKALAEILDGTFDLEAEADRHRKLRRANAFLDTAFKASAKGEHQRAGEAFIQCVAAYPGHYDALGGGFYVSLASSEHQDGVRLADEYARELFDAGFSVDPDALNTFAVTILDGLAGEPAHLKWALKAAQRACEMTDHSNEEYLATLERVRGLVG
ncbi:MAG: TlpA disulfide reductase family protein [Phycisphaerales bacterium JB043]